MGGGALIIYQIGVGFLRIPGKGGSRFPRFDLYPYCHPYLYLQTLNIGKQRGVGWGYVGGRPPKKNPPTSLNRRVGVPFRLPICLYDHMAYANMPIWSRSMIIWRDIPNQLKTPAGYLLTILTVLTVLTVLTYLLTYLLTYYTYLLCGNDYMPICPYARTV